MCIGQDIRGNIKLSHKATLPSPGRFKTNNVAEGSVASAKEKAKIWAPVWNVASTEEKSNSSSELPIGGKHEASGAKSKSTASQIPVFLVRSVAECDEEEKSINKDLSSKGTTVNNGVQSDQKSKSRRSKNMADSPSSESGPLPYKNVKMSKPSTQIADDKATVTAKDLKLGTKVTAKVYQVCAHGLVLELGGGLRGMYQFKENNKSDFNIGDELRVVCSSFNSKGVPVLPLVNDE